VLVVHNAAGRVIEGDAHRLRLDPQLMRGWLERDPGGGHPAHPPRRTEPGGEGGRGGGGGLPPVAPRRRHDAGRNRAVPLLGAPVAPVPPPRPQRLRRLRPQAPERGGEGGGNVPREKGSGPRWGGGVSPTAGSGFNEHQESRCHGRWWVFAE